MGRIRFYMLPLLALMIQACNAPAQFPLGTESRGYPSDIGDKQYYFSVTSSGLPPASTWKLSDNPPLSAKDAYEAARSYIEKNFPETYPSLVLDSIDLVRFDQQRWFYTVTFHSIPIPSGDPLTASKHAGGGIVIIPVLFDGTIPKHTDPPVFLRSRLTQ